MKPGIVFCATAALVAGLMVAPGVARADTTGTQTIPFAETVSNPCNGDVVAIQGTLTMDYDTTSDNAGGFHVSTRFTGKGDSVAPAVPSGSSYTYSDTYQEIQNVHPPYPYTWNVMEKYHLISQGPAPNFYLHMTFHMTINANGVPEVINFDYDTTCN